MGGRSARAGKTRPDKPWRRPGAARYALRRVPGLLPTAGGRLRARARVADNAAGISPVTVRDGTTLRVNVVVPTRGKDRFRCCCRRTPTARTTCRGEAGPGTGCRCSTGCSGSRPGAVLVADRVGGPRLGAHRERRQVPLHPSRRQVAHVLLPRSQRRPARVLRPLPARQGRSRPAADPARGQGKPRRRPVRQGRVELAARRHRMAGAIPHRRRARGCASPPRMASSPSAPGPAAPAGNGPSPPTRRSPGRWRCGCGWRRAAPMTSACSRAWRSGAGGATCRSRGRTGSAGTGSRPAG